MDTFDDWWKSRPLAKANAVPLIVQSFKEEARAAWEAALLASPPEAESEDAKRLDWLEQLTIPSEDINELVRNWKVNGKRYPEGIRASIDAAMIVWP